MAPDIMLERRDIEIADQDHAVGPSQRSAAHARISSRKASLCANFGLTAGIGHVAARGHVEIMQRDRVAQARALAEHRRDVPAIGLAAK